MYQVADGLSLRALEEKLPIIVIGPFNLTKQQMMMKKAFQIQKNIINAWVVFLFTEVSLAPIQGSTSIVLWFLVLRKREIDKI